MSDDMRPVTIEDEWLDDVWGGQVADVVENDRPTHALMPWDAWVEKCAQYDAVCDSEERLRAELAEANKHIEELEQELAYAHRCPFCTTYADEDRIITNEQIDAAWEMTSDSPTLSRFLACFARECFEVMGIVACEKCGGSGAYTGTDEEHDRPVQRNCKFCHAHGWVRK